MQTGQIDWVSCLKEHTSVFTLDMAMILHDQYEKMMASMCSVTHIIASYAEMTS